MIVVLRNPSLADRMAEAGGRATESAMRSWTAAALAGQKQIAARLSREGIQLVPEFVYTRTFNGFAAPIDARALALLERDPDVVGVYPVRAAYPASLSRDELRAPQFAAGGGRRSDIRLLGFDGSGVTIALLDTGIDATHPFIRDRLLDGVDILDPDARALARPHPDQPMRLERHGTQVAGLLVGRGGPGGIRGVAPGATILPIRVAGWQPSAEGGFAVYGRTDQLLAGLERAVDPDADGDVLDAVRIAVVGVTEPFAAFADGPVARAVAGAAVLDTLVVVPAGNEGPAGPGYGSVGGPGGAPAALTVGAADLRRETAVVRVVVRAGLRVLVDRELPLGGAAAPRSTLSLEVMRPRRGIASGPRGTPLARYFDDHGYSIVAGRAALLARADGPADEAREAVLAGAAAILVDGLVPAGALGLDDRLDVPVVGLPTAAAARAARGDRAGQGRPSLARRARLAGQRAACVDRTVLLARPRLRRRRQAGGRGRRRRARHRRSGPERRSDRALRHDQRLERVRRARRRRGRSARPGATRARRRGPEGGARRHRGSGRREPRRRPGRWPRRPRRRHRHRGRRSSGRQSVSAPPTGRAGRPPAGSRSGTSRRDGSRSPWPRRRRESPACR